MSGREDWLAIVRVLCFRQQLDKASDIINETGDPAALAGEDRVNAEPVSEGELAGSKAWTRWFSVSTTSASDPIASRPRGVETREGRSPSR